MAVSTLVRMTRIIAGAAAMVRLEVPPRGTRPTSDKVREALFSSLEAMFEFDGARVLDLYAGSGALALEAISRGAERATLVEQAHSAVRLAKANAAAVAERIRTAQGAGGRAARRAASVEGRAFEDAAARAKSAPTAARRGAVPAIDVVAASVRTYLATASAEVDLVFLDPPYDLPNHDLTSDLAALAPRLHPDALVVVERTTRTGDLDLPPGLRLLRRRDYGETALHFVEVDPDASGEDPAASCKDGTHDDAL